LRENVEDVADENGGEQKNGVSLSGNREFYRQKQPNTRVEHGQKNIDAGSVRRVRRGNEDASPRFSVRRKANNYTELTADTEVAEMSTARKRKRD
jgi:hypothetical protein